MDSAHSQDLSSAEDAVVYVEELAGPDDYWLSITDAARVCRVQDVSIRRAINRKSLPVRRQRAGQNKRTRFVRASDLTRAGFPIIDESAMITTEIGKVDVLSIPRQQQQIVQEHQALMLRLDEMREIVASEQQRTEEALRRQQERLQAQLHALQEEQTHQLANLKQVIGHEQEQLQRSLAEIEQRLATEQQMLRQDLTQTRTDAQAVSASLRHDLEQVQLEFHRRAEHFQAMLNALQVALREHQAEVKQQLVHLDATQRSVLDAYQQTVDACIQRGVHTSEQRFVALEQRVTHTLHGLEQSFNTRLTDLTATLADMQQANERQRQGTLARDQEITRELQSQKAQLEQHEQLMPLLPYTQQRLVVEEDRAPWLQALADLETRMREAQQQEFARYQPLLPLLDLLVPERLEALTRVLLHGDLSNREKQP